MKKIFLSALLLASVGLHSQELDQAYLASLPEDVRADVIEKMEAKEAQEDPVYRRASTMVDKNLEDSVRFGYKIFDMMQSSFMPINEPNFDSSYVLDFGDTLLLQITGQKDSTERLNIERDGSINIPKIGKLYLSGLSLESASNLVKSKIEAAFIGTETFVSLVNIRDIQVLIAGMAFNPGLYTLNGNSNALHALSMAGGITEDGSYRNIDIIRDDKVIASIDLYDLFIYGKSTFGPRLRSGDSIFIRPASILVNIATGVKRPAEYELQSSETFGDLINFANGLSNYADTSYLAVERVQGSQINLIKYPDIVTLSKDKVISGDTLFIREFSYRSVSISGAVEVPGTYFITEGEKLSKLISRSGGYKEFAYPFGGFLNNRVALETNRAAAERLNQDFIQDLIFSTSSQESSVDLEIILRQLNSIEPSGRVMAEFDVDLLSENKNLDTTLEDGDQIIIPYISQQVYIYGEVNNIGTVRYEPGKSVSYYLENSGGIVDTADSKNIYVVHPNGKTVRLDRYSSRLSFINSAENISVYPGTIIFVPRKSSLKNPAQIASIWSPVISSIALSLASLSSINN